MSEPGENQLPRWVWGIVALSLLPLSYFAWLFGLEGVWASDTPPPVDPHPGWTLMCYVILGLSPFVALAAVIWIVVLFVRAVRHR